MYTANLLVFFKDRSFKVKTESKTIILNSWFLGLFTVAFFYTMYNLKTSGNFIITVIFFVLGFTLMAAFYILPQSIAKNKSFITDTLKEEMEPEIHTDDIEDLKTDHQEKLMQLANSDTDSKVKINIVSSEEINMDYNYSEISSQEKAMFPNEENDSSCRGQSTINTDKSSKITKDPNSVIKEIGINSSSVINENDTAGELGDVSSTDSEQNNIFDDVQLQDLKKKSTVRITKHIYYRGADVMPNPFPDEIIKQKIESIKESYLFHCEANDFIKLLKKEEMNKKVLFKKLDGTAVVLSKVDYLNFLYFIFGDYLLEHLSNTKIIDWIDKNFDNNNFVGKKLIIKEISDLRKRAMNQNREI